MALLLPGAGGAESAERAQLWDLLLHSERALNGRTNFFLIAESMFVVGFSVLESGAQAPSASILATGALGLSLVWLILQWKTFNDLAKLLVRMKRADVSKEYLAWKAETSNYLVSHEIIAVVIPALCLVGWLFVLAIVS